MMNDEWWMMNVSFLLSTQAKNRKPFFTPHTRTHSVPCTQKAFEELLSKHKLHGKVAALCTDTPAVMKSTWAKLQEKYPKLICFGCWAHVLQLFLTGVYLLRVSQATLRSACV